LNLALYNPTKKLIPFLAKMLKVDADKLHTFWFADQIYAVVKDEVIEVVGKDINLKKRKK
jgi:hypothetical protein